MNMKQEDTWTLFNTNAAIRILGIDVGNFPVRSWIIGVLQWTECYALMFVYKVLTGLQQKQRFTAQKICFLCRQTTIISLPVCKII